MNDYLIEEDPTRSNDPQVLRSRLRRNYQGAIYEKYRIAYGNAIILDNSLNLKQKKKIVVQYNESDLNVPVTIWANKNIAEKYLNITFRKIVENGTEYYKYKNIILKPLGS